jgi:hypothetical protein
MARKVACRYWLLTYVRTPQGWQDQRQLPPEKRQAHAAFALDQECAAGRHACGLLVEPAAPDLLSAAVCDCVHDVCACVCVCVCVCMCLRVLNSDPLPLSGRAAAAGRPKKILS